MSNAALVLVVDDDEMFRSRLAKAFEDRGYRSAKAATLDEAVDVGRKEQPEFAIVDLRLAEGSGLEVLSGFREVSPKTRMVMLTGYGSIATALEATRLGAVNYLTKPANADEILRALNADELDGSAAQIKIERVPSLARTEWEHIQRVLVDCGGNITHAAERLGIQRRSLQRKLAKNPPRE